MAGSRRGVLRHVLGELGSRMGRTKRLGSGDLMDTPLSRCLSTVDITLLGIGHMVGAGIYVLSGPVARDVAGPGVVLSFLLAGGTSLLAALCYAEFGARVPKAGSAYVYAYVSVGEFWAFVIGWNIILEHMIGAASVARAWSGSLDALAGGAVANWTAAALGHAHPAGQHPDLLAAAVTLACGAALAGGVKLSAAVNSACTVVNIGVIALVVGVGFATADVRNWSAAEGGFLPYGFAGVLAGAANAFYAFIGFDSIATAGEEARDPAKSIPTATLIAMLVVTLLYVLASTALTLMVPYWSVSETAALPDAMAAVGLGWARWAVALGALAGMTSTLLGSLFALPRTVYAMAADGLLFAWLAKVNPATRIPAAPLALAAAAAALVALLVDLQHLVEFMSIGTLLAYTIVSAAVIVLRYRPPAPPAPAPSTAPTSAAAAVGFSTDESSQSGLDLSSPQSEGGLLPPIGESAEGPGRLRARSWWLRPALGRCEPGSAVAAAVAVYVCLCVALCVAVQLGTDELLRGEWWAALIVTVLLLLMIFVMVVVVAHEQTPKGDRFRVPCVPAVPALSILCNVALMAHLPALTWARFVVWMAVGLLVYFLYGIRHSHEGDGSSYSMLLTSPEAGKGAWGSMQRGSSDKTPIVPEEEVTQ